MDIYLEIGKKRVFACALDWQGWSRSGKDEGAAIQALLDYGPRYQRAIEPARLDFQAPAEFSAFRIVERLEGNPGTDFGAPVVAPVVDAEPVGEADLQRFERMLAAMWLAFEAAVRSAEGRELRKGPRGGGRDLQKLTGHVVEAAAAYVRQLGWTQKAPEQPTGSPAGFDRYTYMAQTALGAAARGELPRVGPRGGLRWTPRWFVRYYAWHLLDHTWEIEDRIL